MTSTIHVTITPQTIDLMVWSIVDHGIASLDHTSLDAVRRAACKAGVDERLADLLTDRAAPPVLRERAFGRVAADLARAARRSDAARTPQIVEPLPTPIAC
jgi:hypothetical protein